MLIALLGVLFFAGASVALIARAVAMPRVRAAETITQIGAYGYAARGEEVASGAVRGTLDEIAGFVGGLVAGKLGGVKEAELRNELMAAGLYAATPRKFLGYRILCTVCVPATWVWLAAAADFPAFLALAGGLFAVIAGWVAPMTAVRNRARRRLAQIDYELPELIDVLVVTVEAGLGFSGSLQIAAEKLRCVIQRLVCRDISDLHRLFVREGIEVETVWPLFEEKTRAKDLDPARFSERLSAREPQYKRRWDQELSDLEPDVAPFEEVIRQLRRELRHHL